MSKQVDVSKIHNLQKQKGEENMKHKKEKNKFNSTEISSYTNICKAAENSKSKIRNIDDMEQLAFNTPQPIFYDCNSNMINVPNPFTTVISELQQRIVALSGTGVINRALRNMGNRSYNNAISRLQTHIEDTIQYTYSNAITNSVLSFLTVNMYHNLDQMFLTDNIEKILGAVFNNNTLGMYSIRNLINETEYLLFGQKSLSIEDKNSILFYKVNFVKTEILEEIAKGLNDLARSIAFGTSYCRLPKHEIVPGLEQKDRDEAVYTIFDKNETDSADSTMLFWYIMHRFSIYIENMSPLIEALLWQVVSATNNLLSDSIFDDLIKKYGDLYCDDSF